MQAYILKRLLLIVPTLLGILILNFIIVQAAPGGPVERTLAQLSNVHGGAASRITGAGGLEAASSNSTALLDKNQGMDPELVAEITALYGFDKPPLQRFWEMLKSYATFDFGESFYRDQSVLSLIAEKLPVSISLGLWSTLLIYLISIPLGIMKATRHGTRFDVYSSAAIIIGYAIPGFLFAILLIVLFAGGSYWQIFPLKGLTSDNFEQLSNIGKIKDYFWHLALPITALVISGFAKLTMLTKNSFLEEIGRQYVLTARAKGAGEQKVLYGHIFRNAMLIIVAGLPAELIGILFTGSMLIEIIFSLDGLGLLGYESILNRDYPVVFGTLFIFTLMGLILNLISDLMYVVIDPRIDFNAR